MKRDFFFKQQTCYGSWWNVLITQPDFTCSKCKQVQSTRRAVTRNSFSFEGQAAPTPKWWSFLAPPSPGVCLPAQHSLRGGGNRSRPAPEGDHLPTPCYCKCPVCLVTWFLGGSPPFSQLPRLSVPAWMRVGCVWLRWCQDGKITEAGLGEPQLCSYRCTVCSAHTTA